MLIEDRSRINDKQRLHFRKIKEFETLSHLFKFCHHIYYSDLPSRDICERKKSAGMSFLIHDIAHELVDKYMS